VQVLGIADHSVAFRPEVQLVAGRLARPGTDEVLIGKSLRGRFAGLDLGQRFELRRSRPVQVVGVLAARGSSYESEVWVDINTVRTSFGRGWDSRR
jgi:putative ABC transport system permease protein